MSTIWTSSVTPAQTTIVALIDVLLFARLANINSARVDVRRVGPTMPERECARAKAELSIAKWHQFTSRSIDTAEKIDSCRQSPSTNGSAAPIVKKNNALTSGCAFFHKRLRLRATGASRAAVSAARCRACARRKGVLPRSAQATAALWARARRSHRVCKLIYLPLR